MTATTTATKTLQKHRDRTWAKIENAELSCNTRRAGLEDNLAFTLNFNLNGGIRRNFVRSLWEKAYDEHDLGLLMIYWVELHKRRPVVSRAVKRDKFKRRAVFFWTRNPELPYRVWMTVASENETILYPKSEPEAQDMMFDVTRGFEVPAKQLGRGTHAVEARIRVRWGKHIFTDRGIITGKSAPVKVEIA